MVPLTGMPSDVSVIVPLGNVPGLVAGAVAVAVITPARLSEVVKGMTTGVLYQFGALCTEVVAPYVSVGATLSTMTFGAVRLRFTGEVTAAAVASTSAAAFT